MTTDDKVRDEKLQCNINGEEEKLINMNILQVRKYGEEVYLFSFRKSFRKTNKNN